MHHILFWDILTKRFMVLYRPATGEELAFDCSLPIPHERK